MQIQHLCLVHTWVEVQLNLMQEFHIWPILPYAAMSIPHHQCSACLLWLQLCSGTVHVSCSWTTQARSELESLCVRPLMLTETVFTEVQVTIKVVLTKMYYVNLDNLTIQLLKSAAVTILKCTWFFPSTFLTQHRVFKRVPTGKNLLKSNYTSYWPDAVQLWNSILTLNKGTEYVL